MRKSGIAWATAFVLLTGSLTASVAEASKLSELQEKQSQIKEERTGVSQDISDKNAEISSLKAQQERLKEEVKTLDLEITDTNEKILEKDQEIARKKEEISLLEAEIKDLNIRIEKRNELLKERARSFQRSGGAISYLDVLLGANSFGEFLDRVNAVSTIMEADKQLIKEHESDLEKVEKLKKKQEEELAKLETLKVELEDLKASLDEKRKQKDALMQELRKQQESIENEVMELKEQEELLAAQEAAMKKAIQLEKERLAEIERQRKLAEQNGGSYPKDTGGTFMVPAAGSVTSEFGPRWGEYHYGLDIAKKGSVPIVSAADGVVIRSYYSVSYGNAIFISHSVNGQIYTTVYAHLSSRKVSTGDVVARGQQIGYMGNTGYSFGQHLHFEIHEGPWTANKSNAVNPRKYLSW